MRMNENVFTLFLASIMLFIVVGCGKQIERVSIEGVVTFEGKPLDGGYISIKPKVGPNAGTEIKSDGTYSILKSAGPMSGECEIFVEKFNYRTEKGSDGRENSISTPALPEQINGKPKSFTLKSGQNKINIDLDKW